jgi:hypothetical protein
MACRETVLSNLKTRWNTLLTQLRSGQPAELRRVKKANGTGSTTADPSLEPWRLCGARQQIHSSTLLSGERKLPRHQGSQIESIDNSSSKSGGTMAPLDLRSRISLKFHIA